MLDLFRTLPGMLAEIEGSTELREAFVFAAWRRIAGPSLCEHTQPKKLDGATLTVAVANLTWQRHLQELAGQMLFKVNAALRSPMVSYIEFEIDPTFARVESLSAQDEIEFEKMAEGAITPELFEAAASIEDVELRKQFLLAAGKCLVRRARP